MKLILASQSPRRAEILRRVAPPGMDVTVLPAHLDERAIEESLHTSNPQVITLKLALEKCLAVCARIDGRTAEPAIVVAADTMTVCNGELRGKPVDEADLRRMLVSYRDYPTHVVGSVVVKNTVTGYAASVTDEAYVAFLRFTDAQIDGIVKDPLFYGSAGGFLIEHPLMAHLIADIDGDPETVQGLPGRLVGLMVQDALDS